jgi:hypothetical protein
MTHENTMQLLGAARWIIAVAVVPPSAAAAQAPEPKPVQAQMRNVSFHIDSSIALDIAWLRGELARRAPDQPPYLDDKNSFVLAIDSARVGISPAALSDLLNRYTFAYPGSPLRRIVVTVEGGHLKQQGIMRGIPFTMVGDLTLTDRGELRLHPTSIKAAGLKVGGLMKLFGLHLQKLIKTDRARGIRIDRDDFIFDPTTLLPPPRISGRVGAVEVTDSQIIQTFRPTGKSASPPLTPARADAPSYMFFRHGVLRFGKLTMVDTDLTILDADPRDAFDFFLDRYNDQLVAGYTKNTPDHGLIVFMPDFRRVAGRVSGAAKR